MRRKPRLDLVVDFPHVHKDALWMHSKSAASMPARLLPERAGLDAVTDGRRNTTRGGDAPAAGRKECRDAAREDTSAPGAVGWRTGSRVA